MGSRKPSTSWGILSKSLHFCATCHFFCITRWRLFRNDLGGVTLFPGLSRRPGWLSRVESERRGSGGRPVGDSGAGAAGGMFCTSSRKVIRLTFFCGLFWGWA